MCSSLRCATPFETRRRRPRAGQLGWTTFTTGPACIRIACDGRRKSHPLRSATRNSPVSDMRSACANGQKFVETSASKAGSHRAATAPGMSRSACPWILRVVLIVRVAVEDVHRKRLHLPAQCSARNRNRAAATSAWWIPESLPPVVHREPQRPRRPGQGQSKHAAMRRGLGLRRRGFASSLGRG